MKKRGDSNMKTGFIFLVLGLLLIHNTAPCVALDDKGGYQYTANDKLTRGISNFGTFFLELPIAVYKTSVEENPLMGLTYGMALGFTKSALRLTASVIEVATFPFEPYEPMIEPEFLLFKRKGVD